MQYGIMLSSSPDLAVDFLPVPNPNDQDDQPVILHLAEDPDIAQAVSQ